jgi:tungstate transport system substrate-binding protein
VLLTLGACGGDDGRGAASKDRAVILATTTSTQDSGLLGALIPAFETATGYKVKTIAVGSGQALDLGGRGEADVLLVHSPKKEEELMATGVAASRSAVMHNDFVVVGPAEDPAKAKGKAAAAAFAAIAGVHAPFISRGDESGTNTFELNLWKTSGITPRAPWYQESGQGMGPTLQIASQKKAYTLADRGTYLASATKKELAIIVDGGPGLLNAYHVIPMTAKAGDRVNETGAKAFAEWIVSPDAQRIIGTFGAEKYGQALFVPDAEPTKGA